MKTEYDYWMEYEKSHLDQFDSTTLGPMVSDNEYLRNRIRAAFMAGTTAGVKMTKDAIKRTISIHIDEIAV